MGYEASAQYYDLFGEKPDIKYYRDLGVEYKSALEIGVGTARVALELAKAGVEVWGIDNSPKMLEVARKKIAGQLARVQEKIVLRQADMTDFDLSKKFPLIYMPSSGLSHCISPEDQLSCLSCVYDHLQENGLFAFDLILPHTQYDNTLKLINAKEIDDTVILRWIASRSDLVTQLLHTTLIFEVYTHNTLSERIVETSTVSLIYKRELMLLLEKAHFEITNLYGDFEKGDRMTDLLIVEAQKVTNR